MAKSTLEITIDLSHTMVTIPILDLKKISDELDAVKKLAIAAINFINANVCDPDINDEMIDTWPRYLGALAVVEDAGYLRDKE